MACKCNQLEAYKKYFQMRPRQFLFNLMELGDKFFDQKICIGKEECRVNNSRVVYISIDDPEETND